MPGPTSVTTQPTNPPQFPPPATIGVIAENVINGAGLENWEVQEAIELDEDLTSPDIFTAEESHESGWRDAAQETADYHLLSTGAINFNLMKKDGTQYTCVFTQIFRMRLKPDGQSSRVDHSGFVITHTITWQNNRWEYFSQKVGEQVLVVSAGVGAVRNPAGGWERVPI